MPAFIPSCAVGRSFSPSVVEVQRTSWRSHRIGSPESIADDDALRIVQGHVSHSLHRRKTRIFAQETSPAEQPAFVASALKESCGDARLSDSAPPADTAPPALAEPTAVSTTEHARGLPVQSICAPAIGGKCMRGANRIPMVALAINLWPTMFIDGIVTRQINEPIRTECFDHQRGQNSPDTPMPELCSGKDAVIGGAVARYKTAGSSQNVGDRARTDGQDRRCQQHTNTCMRGFCKSRSQRTGDFFHRRW